ncbi:unnamed protein product [Ranitomeya imitator]|uniref:Helix-turn-helix domain-containing protein n=1 Tax=Ranitomeya imitator TaxID=111125 RepID=A0ABN9LP61_9NEOB|nr:unnamed protein product [Ranitomeya imitator]
MRYATFAPKSRFNDAKSAVSQPMKDTTDVLRRIDGLVLEEDMWLVTCDVESLYTSIDHSHGMRAAKFFLDMTNLGPELIHFILELLQFILTHNFFVFKDRPFLQLQGTAMGASCAPSYANLFLGLWERDTVLDTPGHSSVVSWLRYIDDIFFIWQGSTSQLDMFLNHLNINSFNIKLTWAFSQNSVNFLDLSILKSSDGSIITDVFRKSTSTNALLHFSSSHPPKLKSSIPVGQFLRMRRICSDDGAFHKQAADLTRRFRMRGYKYADINRGYSRSLHLDRPSLLAEAIVYYAQCPCKQIYIGMTTRAFKVRVQEHIRDIHNAVKCSEPALLKSIPRHFFEAHNSNPKGLCFRGIDRVYIGIRGGNAKQRLLQKETHWIVTLNTLSPFGLNEAISFKSFLQF